MSRQRLKSLLKASLTPSQLTGLKRFLGRFLSFKKMSYAQYGEDIFFMEFFKEKTSGFFVDVGAFHPRQFSNTYALYRRGWRGINIDGNPGSMNLFKTVRRGDVNVEALISDRPGVVEFASWGLSSENSADPGQMRGVERQVGKAPTYHRLQAVTLGEIRDRAVPCRRRKL